MLGDQDEIDQPEQDRRKKIGFVPIEEEEKDEEASRTSRTC